MWTTVLVLAIALNLEPNRLGIIALLLLRKHPIRQLLVFLVTSFAVSAAAGLTVLLVVDRSALLSGESTSAKMQIAVGAVALIVAALLFTNIRLPGAAPAAAESETEIIGLGLTERFTKRAGRLASGGSVWFAAALGLGISLPSVDYIALLMLIAASGEPRQVQVTALFTFLIIANTILMVPILSYMIAKEPTIRILQRLRTWVLARSRREYAVLIGLAGALMLAVGLRRL
jgi:hypothetical protein